MSNKILTLGVRNHPNGNIETVALKTKALTTHGCIVGATGSGKSGLIIGMIEDLVKNEIPVLAIDLKGDLANCILQPAGVLDKVDIRFLTPGANHGEAVNIFSGITNPDRITSTVSLLCKMIGVENDPIRSRPHAFLSTIIHIRLKNNQSCTIVDVMSDVVDPPFEYLGMLPVDEVLPKSVRGKLAAKLNNLLAAPGFQTWREGISLNVNKLLKTSPGITPLVIYSVAHLIDDSERVFAISMFLEEILSWMRTQPGTQELQTCLILDEMYGVMPPHPANPPTKKPLLTMLKQARAHGLGIVICSQNPMDLDYKGMSNAQTWLVGRLQTANDRARVVSGICASTPADARAIEASIARLQPRQFLLVRPTGTAIFTSKEVTAELRGPLSPNEIREVLNGKVVCEDFIIEKLQNKLDECRAAFEIDKSDHSWKALEAAQIALEAAITEGLKRV